MDVEFFVNDEVRMTEHGKNKYVNSESNPYNLVGRISYVGPRIVRVVWSNGYTNTYGKKDLELTEEKDTFKSFMRKLDERGTLPKVQRVRARGKTSPKQPTTSNPSEGLGNSVGLSPGPITFSYATTTSSPQPYYTLEEDSEQEELQESYDIEWAEDPDEYDGDLP
jgi:hypothetical protein